MVARGVYRHHGQAQGLPLPPRNERTSAVGATLVVARGVHRHHGQAQGLPLPPGNERTNAVGATLVVARGGLGALYGRAAGLRQGTPCLKETLGRNGGHCLLGTTPRGWGGRHCAETSPLRFVNAA
ncbi:MAG: hypothetical protein KatS3mg077_1221 [Candidatus Binatia bacterium]|nr:MAG: hypothetical protein KatS3mg077_1221 [Candidatus Binatia bacterium]